MKTKTRTKNFKEIMMSDSDSEDDAVMNTVLVWKNNDTVIHAGNKLANNTSKQAINGLPKNMTTIRDKPYNFSRPNNLVNNSYMHRPRETSPMSFRSEVRGHNFRGFSHKSIADGTESMISDARTNASCALDVASAIKEGQYTASEEKIIINALKEKNGKRSIKSGRIKKRGGNKKYINKIVSALLKVLDNDNSDDHSTTSISSEECTSVRSEYPANNGYNRNISYAASLQNYPRNFDLNATRNAHINREINANNNFYGSCRSDNFKRKSFRNMYALGAPKQTLNSSIISMPPPSTSIVPVTQTISKTAVSNVVKSVTNKGKNRKNSTGKSTKHKSPIKAISGGIKESISKPIIEKDSNQQNLNAVNHNEKKNLEPQTPEKLISYSKPHCNLLSSETNNVQNDTNKNVKEDLIFTKPQIPARLSNNPSNEQDEDTSDLTKSSFMRRKLFTQTLEITENRETRDTDHSRSNSPLVNIYANNKSKKSSNSMSNSIEDDNNRTGQQHLLDLVKKIVPAEDMKIITEQKNNSNNSTKSIKANKKEKRSNSLEHLSDTFTDDEDIFLLRKKANDTCILKPPQNMNKSTNGQLVTCKEDEAPNPKNLLFLSSSTLFKNSIGKYKQVANVQTNHIKTKTGINNNSRLGINRKNITNRKANKFWETDTENEADTTQNESIDYGNKDTGRNETEEQEACEEELISDESKENKSINNPEEKLKQNSVKLISSFESKLDDLLRLNPEAYKNHMLKLIQRSNQQSEPQMKTLIVNIERCFEYNNTKYANNKVITKQNNIPRSGSNTKLNLTKVSSKKHINRSPNTKSNTKYDVKRVSPNTRSNTNNVKKKSLKDPTINMDEVKRQSPNVRSNNAMHEVKNSNTKVEVKRSISNIRSNNTVQEVKNKSSNVKSNNTVQEVKRTLSNIRSNTKVEVKNKSSIVKPNNTTINNSKKNNAGKQTSIKNQPANKNKETKTDNRLEDSYSLRPRRNRTITPQSDNINKISAINKIRSRNQRFNDSSAQSTPVRPKRNITTSSYDDSIIINNKRNKNTLMAKCIVQESTPVRPKRSKATNLDDSFVLTNTNNKRRKYF